jgi:hypothetical protein
MKQLIILISSIHAICSVLTFNSFMRKLFLIQLLFLSSIVNCASQVVINVNCKPEWGPGRFTRVQIDLNFVGSESIARYSQDFPIGFDIIPDQVPDGDFDWTGNQLNIVWLKLPEGKKTSFSFYVKPDVSMSGQFEFQGKVIVISEGTSRNISLTKSIPIEIRGTGGLLPADIPVNSQAKIVTNVTNQNSEKEVTNPGKFEFRIQVTTSSANNPREIRNRLRIGEDKKITVVRSGNAYKYQVGSFTDYQSARSMLQELVKSGISDAFIVAYEGNEQVPVEKATARGK